MGEIAPEIAPEMGEIAPEVAEIAPEIADRAGQVSAMAAAAARGWPLCLETAMLSLVDAGQRVGGGVSSGGDIFPSPIASPMLSLVDAGLLTQPSPYAQP